MQACLLCDRPEDALSIYNDHIGSEQHQIADEWQWGGKSDRVDPLCRDLAMQAMVRTRGMSDTALEFFQQTRQEGVTISIEALRGVVGACECDRRWMDAVSILYEILENAKHADWIVPGSGMVISDRRDGIDDSSTTVPSASVAVRWLPEIGGVLASAVRACNASSKFGVSLLLFRLVDIALPSSGAQDLVLDRTSERLTESLDMRLEQSLIPLFLRVRETEELLPATMDALGGLRCFKNAANLFNLVHIYSGGGQLSIPSRQRYDRALDQVLKHADKVIGNAFESANRHIHRLTAAVQTIQGSGVAVCPEGRKKIEDTLAAAMHACTDAYQPETSLYLALWTEKALNPPSLETMNRVGARFGTDISSRQFLGFRTDAVLAEAISAFRFSRRETEATELFQALHSRHEGDVSQWRLGYTAGLSAMVANGRVDEALELFNRLGGSGRTVDMFTVMAQGLLREKKWPEVYELYRFAQSKGCMSEDLGILAIRSVILSREEGKLFTIRGIVDDTASCAGMDSERFLASRYWHLKRALGFNWARLLMWWNDRDTCHLDELALALHEFKQRRLCGLKAKHEAIRVILENAISFQEGSVPDHRKDLVTLPRTKPEWLELLLHVLEETRDSPLHQDADFIDYANQALSNLNCTIGCAQSVNESLLKGER
jgi:hypothetical protein